MATKGRPKKIPPNTPSACVMCGRIHTRYAQTCSGECGTKNRKEAMTRAYGNKRKTKTGGE